MSPILKRSLLCVLLLALTLTLADTPAEAQTTLPRVMIGASGGIQSGSDSFTSSIRFTLFAEEGDLESDYEVDGGAIFDGGASVLVWRNVGVGLNVSRFSSSGDARISARLPHPFFFDLPRTVTGTEGNVQRQELVVHLHGAYIVPVNDWLTISVFGGPSFFNVKQDLVEEITHRELGFPFDTAEFVEADLVRVSESAVGGHVGFDASFFVLPGALEQVGFGVLVRYSRAELDVSTGQGDQSSLKLGGVHAAGGVRFRF